MYAAVLCDVYGTLVRDDETWAHEVVAAIAARAGVDPEDVATEWDTRIWAMADAAHGPAFRTLADLNTSSLTATATHFGVRVDVAPPPPPRPPLFADSLPFLAAVKVPVCLVSDADNDRLRAVLDHHRITVAAVVTSEDARAYKPRPEPFALALRRLGVATGEMVHVGDSPAADVVGAAALGIATAFLSRDGRRLPPHLTATHTITTLTDLVPLLG
ncbi:HAD family hydrolase [Asanoa sp. WMMD1127]|uniref:HAD family hydrolase n=1 Tax=Asanoa sp. WMMD1127 TaxID=3016107 RepID=UPI0024168451|nr:HAD family hydrolase [Asanoa sp. WMMD1127]MDG4826108.1 HAD family hydrolase [Asanoa sp. WMMD1127]